MSNIKTRIIIADKDDEFRKLVNNVFEKRGWIVHLAKDGQNILRMVHEYTPDIILMDIDLPRRDGITNCSLIRNDVAMNHHYPVLLMSGKPSKQLISRAVDAGCDDFLIKPFKFDTLLEKIDKILGIKVRQKTPEEIKEQPSVSEEEEQEAEVILFSKEVIKQTFANAKKGKMIPYPLIRKAVAEMLEILREKKNLPLAFKMKSYNEYTYVRSINVASLSMSFAYHLNWDEKDIVILGEGALLHDVGITKVNVDFLTKPDKLNDAEYAEMKKHSEYSREILTQQNLGEELNKIALQHHEHVDGTGYPNGLRGEKICKYAKLITVVDVYDAMTTDRSYKESVDAEDALKEMNKDTGHFDPQLLGDFNKLILNDTIGK